MPKETAGEVAAVHGMISPYLALGAKASLTYPACLSARIVLSESEKSMSSFELRKSIEVELTKIRRIAEQADNDYLLYYIDIAISEAGGKPNHRNDNSGGPGLRTAMSGLKQG